MVVPAGLAFTNFALVAIFVAVLYFTREIVAPIALAVLLSFVLAPLVRLLQRWQLPKSLAVIFAVLSALAIASGLAAMVTIEVTQLGNDLPRYETTLGTKSHKLRDNFGSAGVFKNASNLLKDLDKDLKASDRGDGKHPPSDLTNGDARKTPIPVEVHQPEPGASEALLAVLKPLVSPFATIGIVVIFLAFFLFQREDLRNRFIRLAGSNDLERTTSALDDAGRRLSRLFMTQLILNAVFGAVIGSGLAIIGVPSAPLWGLLAMALRFVPYIGAVMAAAFPIALARRQ
jgi:predicted PurR-regulated permease PerM